MNTYIKSIRYILTTIVVVFVTSCQVIPSDEQRFEVFTPNDSASIKRTSLLIEYSGWRCVNCPLAAEVAHHLKEQYGQELVVVVMHPESNPNTRYGTNQAVNYTCPEADSIYMKMGGTSSTPFPTGNVNMLNATGDATGYMMDKDKWATYISQAYSNPLPITISQLVTEGSTPNSIDIDIDLRNLDSKEMQVTAQVWLTEDEVVGKQKMPDNTTNDAYVHNHLMRASISPIWGEPIQIAANSSYKLTYQYTLPDRVVAANCNIVCVITMAGQVVQAAESKISANK